MTTSEFQRILADVKEQQAFLVELEADPNVKAYVLLQNSLALAQERLKEAAKADATVEAYQLGNTEYRRIIRTDITYPVQQIIEEAPDLYELALSFDPKKAKEIPELNEYAQAKQVPYFRAFPIE